MSFDGVGSLLFLSVTLASGYVSIVLYFVLSQDVSNGCIKLWLSCPVSRFSHLLMLWRRVIYNGTLYSILLILLSVAMISVFFGTSPRNIYAVILGSLQLAMAITALSMLLAILIRGTSSIFAAVVIPITRLLIYVRSAFYQRGMGEDSAGCIAEWLLPMGAGYRNLVFGHCPGFRIQGDVFNSMASLGPNIYTFVWSLAVLAISAFLYSKKEY